VYDAGSSVFRNLECACGGSVSPDPEPWVVAGDAATAAARAAPGRGGTRGGRRAGGGGGDQGASGAAGSRVAAAG
jgi:hypothetical protein